MSKDVAATWAGIEAWAGDKRPELLENLRGPAGAADIATLRGTGLRKTGVRVHFFAHGQESPL